MEAILKAAGDGDLESLESTSRPEPGVSMEAILKAACDGDLESLERMGDKEKGTVAAARDSQRRTALHLAAGEGHTEVCEYLVAKLELHVDPIDIHGETPLCKATMHGHVQTVECLLINKADPHVKSRCGVTTLHQAATLGNSQLTDIFIGKGVELNSDCHMGTPLACAIESASFVCFKALVKAGAAPDGIMYPLHSAAEFGNVDIVEWFLKAGRDPNSCNNDGLKPIQLAASHSNLKVVELLFPHTTPFLDNSNWTVAGVIEKGLLLENEAKGMELLSTTKAALKRSQFVLRGTYAISDEEIEQKLGEMLLPNEYNFFEGWSAVKKRLFFESTFITPSSLKQISDNGMEEIKNSVIFDLTNKDKAQSSYLRAINVYRAWHFSGTDLIYEIGPQKKRFCVSRKDQTFIFWFRYLDNDVGLVIDGQSVWAEGMMRRTRGKDGRFKYASPIQFSDTRKDGSSSSSSSKQKALMRPPYIVHSELIMADYGGTYAGHVSKVKYSIGTTRSAVLAVTAHDKTKSLGRDCHPACDNLVFFATEAGKNLWAYQYTMHCLDPKLTMPLAVPKCFDGTVTNHQQVSENVLKALKTALEATTAGKKLRDLPRGGYKIVAGAVFRTLWQCLDAYVILRRHAAFKTRFFLKGKEAEYRSQEKNRPQKQRHESDAEFEERVREERVRTGTLFDPKLHSGLARDRLSVCTKPLKPAKKIWYNVDEPDYV